MAISLIERWRERIYEHRARWSARQIKRFLKPTDRVLDVGAGDCRLDLILQKRVGCEIVPIDVEDFNRTSLKLVMFDGKRLPFPDDSFDVVLLIFVLHHAEDVKAVFEDARRVSRKSVIVLEDVTSNAWDRLMFRGFHKWLAWSEKISFPFREWRPAQWTEFATAMGMSETWSGNVGRQLSIFGCRHVLFVWDKVNATQSTSP